MIDYMNLNENGNDVNVKFELEDGKTFSGRVYLYKCNIT
jgi:hypothetical protein